MENQEKQKPEIVQKGPKSMLVAQQKKERISIFIDGSNLYHGLKKHGLLNIRFQDLIDEIAKDREIYLTYFYTPMPERSSGVGRYVRHKEFLSSLSIIPKFKIVPCRLKRIIEKDGNIRFEVKGDDVHLANDFLVGVFEDKFDTAILISGDEDFKPVVRTARKKGKRVENMFFRSSSSARLRKLCDSFQNLNVLLEKIRRPGITK